jgi:hypothetical protein
MVRARSCSQLRDWCLLVAMELIPLGVQRRSEPAGPGSFSCAMIAQKARTALRSTNTAGWTLRLEPGPYNPQCQQENALQSGKLVLRGANRARGKSLSLHRILKHHDFSAGGCRASVQGREA